MARPPNEFLVMATVARRRELIRAAVLKPLQNFGWSKKHDVAMAIRTSVVSLEEVMAAHGATAEEVNEWLATFDTVYAFAAAHAAKAKAAGGGAPGAAP